MRLMRILPAFALVGGALTLAAPTAARLGTGSPCWLAQPAGSATVRPLISC